MSTQDDSKHEPDDVNAATERDSEPPSDASPEPSESKRSAAEDEPRRSSKKGSGKSRRPAREAAPAPSGMSSSAMLLAVLALAAGGAGGWFGHIAQAQAKLRADSVAAPAGSGVPAGPCGAWQSKICASSGEQSAACGQAKGAAELLTPPTCELALAGVPATLAKVKAARAPCDKLVSKLCTDLPPGSTACGLVKERTPSFPPDRCSQMLEHYSDVLGELRQMDQQGAQMGGPHGGMPPGAMPPGHGMPPGAMPPGHGMPPGAAAHAMPPGAAPPGAP